MTRVLVQGGAGAAGLTFAFLAAILHIIAIIAAVMGVQVALRVYSEETSDRVEPLLAGPLRRHAYLASHAIIALASTAVAMLVAGIALGLVAHGADSAVSVGDVIAQSLVAGPDAPTLGAGWKTRDLAAHLVVRESRPDAAAGVIGG